MSDSDAGPDWTAPASTAGLSVSGSSSTYSTGDSITLDGTVPDSTPSTVFQTERYGDMQWDFDVTSGQQYEVRLYFAEIFASSSAARQFDVSIEGQQVLNDYDIYADVGDDVGTVKTFTATPTDDTLDVDFTTVLDNAKLSAIEILPSEPQPNELGGSSSVDFGTVVTGNSDTETVTVTNLGGSGDPPIDLTDISVTGTDAGAFSAGAASQTSLAPGESATIPVTFTPSDAQAKSASLEVSHSGTNSPLTVSLSGEGASDVPIGFGESELQGFNAGGLTALEFGPDGRLYVAQQGGTIYALEIERDGPNSYQVVSQESIGAINDIPNHDDDGSLNTGQNNRQVTGLTVGGTEAQPVVYVSSSDPRIGGGGSGAELDLDTNSGTISRLTFDWNSDGSLANVDHDVLVMGLPRSEENHAPNGLDLSDDGTTLYLAQGGNTNKGAPSNNFAYTPEYALSSAALAIDLAQIENEFQAKNLQNYSPPTGSGSYPDLTFYYGIPTIQNDDSTDGDDLPFGGQDGVNMAKVVENGPVQVYSPGYRNPYDLVLSEDDQLYVIDNGPNGNWGGQPVDEGPSGICTNEPNEAGSYSTGDQLHLATEGSYGGHAVPIRANPTGADIYDENGNVVLDIDSSNSPVPASEVNPIECDYQDPSEDNSLGDTFGWTGGIEEYTASNFGGAMQGDLLVVEGGSNVERVELNANGDAVTNQENNFLTPGTALGIEATGDEGPFPGTIWTARGDLHVYEPNDYGGSTGPQCTGADDPSLDEDGDGYDNADEIDVGTDPCSSGSTPPDFDDDGTSNLNDPDDDNDGTPDTSDPFAVDPNDGTTTSIPVTDDLTETMLFGENSQAWTGLMTNGQDDYQDLYEDDPGTVGGAAGALLIEGITTGDATQNNQDNAFQFGATVPDEPFVVSTTVNGFPENPSGFQGIGLFVGTGDQDNYTKLVVSANNGQGGVQLFQEVDGSNNGISMTTDGAVTGPDTNTNLYLTVDPTTDPNPGNSIDEVAVSAEYSVGDGERQAAGSGAMPASWLDSSDGTAPAFGIISTSYQAGSTFDGTWKNFYVQTVDSVGDEAPTADAGTDQTVDEGTQVALDASGSSDPNGDQLGFSWVQTVGPNVQFDIQDTDTPSFTAPEVSEETTLTFEVTVSDGTNSDTDTVNVTVQDTDTGSGDLTVAEAVASYNDDAGADDTVVDTQEIQTAINWWATGAEVPNTGGQVIDTATIQVLINDWATGAPVDGGSNDGGSGQATVAVTQDSGISASTYGGGSFEITNTGEQQISSVSFDVSESLIPDAVFDPDGTAGDSTAKQLAIDSQSGGDGDVGVVSTADGDVFSQPHNGQDDAEGYDVMTLEFDDFDPGESVGFSIDMDPTTIKGVSGSGGAGSVSGLEVAGSAVTVEYADGSSQQSDLFGDGSSGGAQATVGNSVPAAPSLGVQGVSLQSTDFPSHSAATVGGQSQTLTVSGPAGGSVQLLQVEASEPPSGGYDLDAFEADDAEAVGYQTVSLDANGQATVQVSLSESNLNYFLATVESGDGTGQTSQTVILDYDSGASTALLGADGVVEVSSDR